MLSFACNVRMSEKLQYGSSLTYYGYGYLHACTIRVTVTALLEYIPDYSIRVYQSY